MVYVVYSKLKESVDRSWLVMLEEINDNGTNDDDYDNDTDTDISSILTITTGPASWKKDRIVMGGMIFTPNKECDDTVRHKRRMLLQEKNDIEQNENKKDDFQSFDPILIHRALQQRVDSLSGSHLRYNGRMLRPGNYYDVNTCCMPCGCFC
jgi:hypothetical protein